VHENLSKGYEGEMMTVGEAGADVEEVPEITQSNEDFTAVRVDSRLPNSALLPNLEGKLTHLAEVQRYKLGAILRVFPEVLCSTPSQTAVLLHDAYPGGGGTTNTTTPIPSIARQEGLDEVGGRLSALSWPGGSHHQSVYVSVLTGVEG